MRYKNKVLKHILQPQKTLNWTPFLPFDQSFSSWDFFTAMGGLVACQDNKRITYGSVEDAKTACEGMGSVQCGEPRKAGCGWMPRCLFRVAATLPKKNLTLRSWWFRNPAITSWYREYPEISQGFIDNRWLFGMSSINYVSLFPAGTFWFMIFLFPCGGSHVIVSRRP